MIRFIPGTWLFLLFCVTACEKPSQQARQPATTRPPHDTSIATTDSLALLLRSLEPKLAPVVARLHALPTVLRADSGTARADSLFLRERVELEKTVAEATSTIDTKELERVVYPDTGASARVFADSVVAFTERRGAHVYGAEGNVYFQPSITAQLEAARPYVTPSMVEYLEIARAEQLRPTGGDAALLITWEELGQRVARLERFELAYPNSAAYKLGHDLFLYELRWYLRGADNTPAFDRRTRMLEPELRQSYNTYMANNPNTPTTKLLRGYLAVLEKNGFKDSQAALQYLRESSPLQANSVF